MYRGGGGDGRDGRVDGLNLWEDNLENIILWTEPNAPLDYALVLELYHHIMSTLGGHKGR